MLIEIMKERNRALNCFVTHSFLDKVWDYPSRLQFPGYSVNDCDY